MKKRVVLFLLVFVVFAGLAIADDVIVPGKAANTPWFQQIWMHFERVFQFFLN